MPSLKTLALALLVTGSAHAECPPPSLDVVSARIKAAGRAANLSATYQAPKGQAAALKAALESRISLLGGAVKSCTVEGDAVHLSAYLGSADAGALIRPGELTFNGQVPAGSPGAIEVKDQYAKAPVFVGPAVLTRQHLAPCGAKVQLTDFGPALGITFTETGKKLFADLSTRLVGKKLAILIDGKPVSIPVVREPITGGKAQISFGNDSVPFDAATFAAVLLSPPIPKGTTLTSLPAKKPK